MDIQININNYIKSLTAP